jgi:hypothetical protein
MKASKSATPKFKAASGPDVPALWWDPATWSERKLIGPTVATAHLLERGWTHPMIRKFLGEPDETAVNPRGRHGKRLGLYKVERVKEVEASAEFQEAIAKRKGKK